MIPHQLVVMTAVSTFNQADITGIDAQSGSVFAVTFDNPAVVVANYRDIRNDVVRAFCRDALSGAGIARTNQFQNLL